MSVQMAGGFGKFVGAAQQGKFAVDTNSAREMIMSIGEVRQQLADRLRRIAYLKQQAKLGDLPEAQRIAELDAEVASGDQQSLEYVLQRFAEALDEAHQALEIGMRNYEQIEAQAKEDLRRAGGI
ncbi:MAG: hypothetical protein ACT4NY_22750 [Pseudonocardiales bacterium]